MCYLRYQHKLSIFGPKTFFDHPYVCTIPPRVRRPHQQQFPDTNPLRTLQLHTHQGEKTQCERESDLLFAAMAQSGFDVNGLYLRGLWSILCTYSQFFTEVHFILTHLTVPCSK